MSAKLQTRLWSAAVLIPISLTIIYVGGWLFVAFLILAALRSQFEWGRLTAHFEGAFLWWIIGLIYIIATFVSCYLLRTSYDLIYTAAFFIMVWGSDAGAYAVGKIVGGPKLAKEISPNKTWSGYCGALIAPMVLALFFFPADIWPYAALFGLAMGATGQSGDLLISWIKRRAGVKDCGHLIPGHGGVLDRIDAMMLCAPVFYAFTIWAL